MLKLTFLSLRSCENCLRSSCKLPSAKQRFINTDTILQTTVKHKTDVVENGEQERKIEKLGSENDSHSSNAVEFDQDLINHLERNSLVDFDSKEAISRLQEAISFANTLGEVDTSGVEPMISVLENEMLLLRKDKVEKTTRSDILKNASVTEEDYFVAPPGNIPLEQQNQKMF